ncbi:ArsR/SmtB family transcription factor [Kocuria kalidii]
MTDVSWTTGLEPAVALFRSLSDPTRLADGEARVRDPVEQTGRAQSTVSAHVACLRGCGPVAGRAEGREAWAGELVEDED